MEMVIVLAIIASVSGAAVPVLANGADAKRTRDAAAFVAGQFRLARQRAVMTGRNTAIVFDGLAPEVGWRLCEDGDRDGVSRADINSGADPCEALSQPLSYRFSKVGVGYLPGVPSPDGELNAPPLKFGAAQMATFTPAGTSSSGTIAILGAGSAQWAVRVSGVTGRTRTLRFDPGSKVWLE
jgi:type II secretory pathway pseudopilin PulG